MDIQLVQLSPDDGRDVYEMLQRIDRRENDFNNEAKGMTYEEYRKWLAERDSWSRGEALPDGYVKQWIYWLKVDGVPVGIGKLREHITQESTRWGGNIGFAVDSQARGKGYGLLLFQMLLRKASDIGIDEIVSTVMSTNVPSRKVHEKLGGELFKEDGGILYYRFNEI